MPKHCSTSRLLAARTCYKCGEEGHYTLRCPRWKTPVAETPVAESPVAETPVAETLYRCENITHQSEATPTTRGATATNSTVAAGSTSSEKRGDSGSQPSSSKEKCAATSPVATTSLASTAIATATTIAASTAAINAAAASALGRKRRNAESQPSSSNKQATTEISEDSKAYSGASQENVAAVLSEMASGGDLGLGLAETARGPEARVHEAREQETARGPGAEPAVGLLQARTVILPAENMRTVNKANLAAETTTPPMTSAGDDYGARGSAAQATQDHPLIRPNRNFLVEDIAATTPESDLMRCGDVERKLQLHQPDHMGVSNYTHGNLKDMLIRKENPCFEDEMDADGHITGS